MLPASPNILVVDDHDEIRDLVRQVLERDGYRVTLAANGQEMRRAIDAGQIDLIVLDLMLPDESGLALCRDFRAKESSIPIIILSAKGDEIDRVLGLEMGADDYLSKPFSGRELLARVKAVLRRLRPLSVPSPASRDATYVFGSWKLHTSRRELESEDAVVVPLSTGEFNLLLAFLQNPQRVLSRDRLLDLAKGRTSSHFDRSIDIQVSRLRRRIGDNARKPEMIKTVWGGGYFFTPRVSVE